MEKMKKPRVNRIGLTIALMVLVGFFIGILFYTLGQISEKKAPKKPIVKQEEMDGEIETKEEPTTFLGVLKEIDLKNKTILVYNITKDQTMKLGYEGATDIRDKYSQVIAASQLIVGTLIEIQYEEQTQMLTSIMNSKDAWEYTNVTDLNIDRTEKIIKLYGDKYKYTSKLYVRNEDGEGALLSINSDDVLTVRGFEKTIYSIEVTKGHGSIKIEDCGYFEGGIIHIKGVEYQEITSDMVFTVREGKVEIEVQKDDVKESMIVEVMRNKEIAIDLSVLNPNPVEKGEVAFIITPFGAELSIDSVLTSYANPIELDYGEHSIEVTLNGYETYTGMYELNQSTDIVQIELAQTVVTETPEDEETKDKENQNNSTTPAPTPTPTQTTTSTPSKEETEDKNEYETSDSSDEQSTSTDKDHFITVKSPSGVGVYVNGIFKGIAPIKIEKPLGLTYITLIKEGYEQITHTINIKDDKGNKYYSFPPLKIQE